MGPDDTALLVDAMCGKLATHLRMCGYDASYAPDRGVEDDDRLLAVARAEGRLLLTRDEHLAARSANALLLESTAVADQLATVEAADLTLSLDDPVRCSECNARLEPADGPTPAYAPDPSDRPVWRCPDCGQCFWKGSHWDAVEETLADL